jgi:hypothetical protein
MKHLVLIVSFLAAGYANANVSCASLCNTYGGNFAQLIESTNNTGSDLGEALSGLQAKCDKLAQIQTGRAAARGTLFTNVSRGEKTEVAFNINEACK